MAQTSWGPLPEMLLMAAVRPVGVGDQAAPVQCRMVPWSPPTQTSSGPLPQMAQSGKGASTGTAVHTGPFQRATAPANVCSEKPTAHTSSRPLPQTVYRVERSSGAEQSVPAGQQSAASPFAAAGQATGRSGSRQVGTQPDA